MEYLRYLLIAICFSCQSKKENIQEKLVLNENLIYTNFHFMADLGDESWEKLQSDAYNKIEPKYLDDIIYVSHIVDLNACGNYVGDIEIKKDSIYLICKTISEEVCTSTAVYKATYIIKNSEIKKYKIAIRYD